MQYKLLLPIAFLLFLSSCKKETIVAVPITNETLIYYDKNRRDQVVSQIYLYDGFTEKNITNDPTHNYWWVKVANDKTKFLCYRSPKISINYLENTSNDYANADLMLFNSNGTNPSVIIPKGANGWQEQGVAKFSPDGTKIFMAALCKDPLRGSNDFHWRLVVTNSNGTNPKIITTRNSLFADLAWSPDGRKIVYVTLPPRMLIGTQNQFELYVADYNTITKEIFNETRLTTNSKYFFDRHWSPDGKCIAHSRSNFLDLIPLPGNADIIRIKPDGSDEKVVIDDDKLNGVPYWLPDSKRIYFHALGWGIQFSIASCDGINGGDKKYHLAGGGPMDQIYSTPQVIIN